MHPTTFDDVTPTDEQLRQIAMCREGVKTYALLLEAVLPDGPDKTYILRKLRELKMWVNVAITRQPDGAPRT